MSKKTKIAIVTGGARGIGKAIVKALVKMGLDVLIIEKDTESVELAKKYFSRSKKIQYAMVDLGDRKSIVKFCKKWKKPIYAIINNAGICITEYLHENKSAWDQVLNVNLHGVYFLTKGLVKKIVPNGRIVNISSQLGKSGRAGYSAYCASKFGIIGLTECWAKELGEKGITVNAVCPSWVKTEMAIKDVERMAKEKNMSPKELYAEICRPLELKRFTEPEEVAHLVSFLVSEKASGITGRSMLMNTLWNQK